MNDAYHVAVLLREAIEGLEIRAGGVYADATFGGGSHSRAIIEALEAKEKPAEGAEGTPDAKSDTNSNAISEGQSATDVLRSKQSGRLFAFDRDRDAAQNTPEHSRLIFVDQDFRLMQKMLRLHGVRQLDGILADLGISSHQIDTPERGFSTRYDAKLDMRMDGGVERTAAKLLAELTEDELVLIFQEYGELPGSKALAAAIISRRLKEPILTTTQLKEIAAPFVRGNSNRYYAMLFQALRIAVNDEMGALKALLEQSAELLRPGGRLVVITYHSIEDRLVKRFMRHSCFEDQPQKDRFGNPQLFFRLVNKKPITPSVAEVKRNPRARSAKLRIAQRI